MRSMPMPMPAGEEQQVGSGDDPAPVRDQPAPRVRDWETRTRVPPPTLTEDTIGQYPAARRSAFDRLTRTEIAAGVAQAAEGITRLRGSRAARGDAER